MTRGLVGAALLAAAALGATLVSAQQVATVAQKRRAFAPGELTIAAGSTVLFVNDDGELLHHVFARAPGFSFDIGEQPGGTRTPVRFPVRGVFEVRCEIHPRMLLTVTVR